MNVVVSPVTKRFTTCLALLVAGVLFAAAAPGIAAPVSAQTVSATSQASPISPTSQLSVDAHHVDVFAPSAPVSAMFILMHGLDLSAPSLEQDSLELLDHAGAAGWLMVYPDAVGGSWNAGLCCQPAVAKRQDDVGFVVDLAATIRTSYQVPADVPLIIGGFSNGAMMAAEVLCRRPGLAAGALLMSGDLQDPTCSSARAREIVFIHGTGDDAVPIKGAGYTTALQTSLFPDTVTLRAAELGLRCGSTQQTRSADARLATMVCGHDRLTYIRERGSHHWLTGDSEPATSTLRQVEVMLQRLSSGRP